MRLSCAGGARSRHCCSDAATPPSAASCDHSACRRLLLAPAVVEAGGRPRPQTAALGPCRRRRQVDRRQDLDRRRHRCRPVAPCPRRCPPPQRSSWSSTPGPAAPVRRRLHRLEASSWRAIPRCSSCGSRRSAPGGNRRPVDGLVLASVLCHEMAHARGLDEPGALADEQALWRGFVATGARRAVAGPHLRSAAGGAEADGSEPAGRVRGLDRGTAGGARRRHCDGARRPPGAGVRHRSRPRGGQRRRQARGADVSLRLGHGGGEPARPRQEGGAPDPLLQRTPLREEQAP